MPPPIPVVLIGAGQRGTEAFASYALRRPEEIRVVAVADPNETRRTRVAEAHQIPLKRRFRNWQDLLDNPLMGEAALVCTPDEIHVAPAIGAMEAGYHVVLETPAAQTPEGCFQLVQAAEARHKLLMLTHVLRYTAFYRAMHDIVQSGRLGQLVTYQQQYTLPFWLMAHRFVRGHEHSPLILSVGCHEFDLMQWILKEPVQTVSSMGSLQHFHLAAAPVANIPDRCLENCPIEPDCPFSAMGTYLERRFPGMPASGFPYTSLADGDENANKLVQAVEEGRWGRCVYHMSSPVVDHQAVMLQTASGISATVNISGHGASEGRIIRIDGSHGSMVAEFIGLDSHITVTDHASGKQNNINFRIGPTGHGGDHGLMGTLVKVLRDETPSLTTAQNVINSHLIAFAAEEARQTQQVVDFPAYQRQHFR